MATIDINSISNAQLKQLATEIDNSEISAKDNMIDDTEFGVFEQRAKAELLDKKQITNADYKAIFGLEKDNDKVNADLLANEQIRKNVAKTDSIAKVEIAKNDSINEDKKIKAQMIREAILSLENNIDSMRNELYEGRYDEIVWRGKVSANKAMILFGGGGTLGMLVGGLSAGNMAFNLKVGEFATYCIGVVGSLAGAVIAIGGIALGCHLYSKAQQNKHKKEDEQFLRQCEQKNPQLHQALQEAEKQLAELQKQLEQL